MSPKYGSCIHYCGLLASLSNLVQASNSLLKILKSFKNGDKELHKLFNGVSVFAKALKGFDRVLRSPSNKSPDINDSHQQRPRRSLQDQSRIGEQVDSRTRQIRSLSVNWPIVRLLSRPTLVLDLIAFAASGALPIT